MRRGGWRIAIRNLTRNRRRNVLTGLSLAVGYVAIVLLGGYVVRVELYLRTVAVYLQHAGHVSIYRRGGLERYRVRPASYALSADDQATIEQVLAKDANVAMSTRYLAATGLAGNGCITVPFVALGMEPGAERAMRDQPDVRTATPELARPLRGVDLATADREDAASLSAGLARLLGKDVDAARSAAAASSPQVLDCQSPGASARIRSDSTVQLLGATFDGSFSAVDATVVGIHTTGMSDTEDTSLYAPLALIQRLSDTDAVTYFAVLLKDPSHLAAKAHALEETLRGRGLDVDVVPFDDERISMYYVGTIALLKFMTVFIALIVSLVVVLGIVNATTMTVIERSRELGTLRSLGFRRGEVLGLFLREGLALTAIALGVGLVVALAAAAAIKAAGIRYAPAGIPGTVQFVVIPTATVCEVAAAGLVGLAVAGVAVSVVGRLKRSVADLNAAVSG